MINEDKKIDRMKITVLTGAGMSAESGLKTFRDSDGLWEGHDVMEVASPVGWKNNPELVPTACDRPIREPITVAERARSV